MSHPQPIVFVVDDDSSVLKSVSRLLHACGFDVITYNSSRKFLQHCNPATHGCIVLDLAMPEMNGLELQEALAAKGASLPVIFLTAHGDIRKSVHAVKHGAIDFLTKPVHREELQAAVRTAIAADRRQWLIRTTLSDIRKRLDSLTPREHEVLRCVISGRLNKQSAAELGISEKTIKVHRARVMEKMKVTSLAELVHLADQVGLGMDVIPGGFCDSSWEFPDKQAGASLSPSAVEVPACAGVQTV